jgi:DNA-directed RNA polymerase specialized sigma24 family protein
MRQHDISRHSPLRLCAKLDKAEEGRDRAMSRTSDQSKSDFMPNFDALIACCEQRILRFHLASSRNLSLARTLTEETFSRARSQKKTFRGDMPADLWIMRFALDVVPEAFSDHMLKPMTWQARARQLFVGPLKRTNATQELSFVDAQVLKIWKAVAELPNHLRGILILRAVEDIEPSEISIITGLPLEQVRSHLDSAMAALKRAIEVPAGDRSSELERNVPSISISRTAPRTSCQPGPRNKT